MYVGTDVTISKCVEMCALRPWCEALLYRRQVPLCELFSETGLIELEKTEVAGYCQFMDKQNFSPEMALLRTRCKDLANQKCPKQYIACDLENNACLRPECPIPYLTNGWFDGNMNTNGSRKRINCNQRHGQADGSIVTTCINGTWTPLPKCIVNDWRMFIGVPGVGEDIADSWKHGKQTTTQLDSCFNMDIPSCKTHFRDPWIDKWSELGVQSVKVSMYKDGKPAAFVEFDAKGSNMTSWFDQVKIISSSWNLTPSSTIAGFTLDGRFYIVKSWNGCQNDISYMIALAKSNNDCPYEQKEAFPVFLYSKRLGPGRSSNPDDFGVADKLVIEVKYSEEYRP
ncbi:hypothetical protein DPMN_063937 [Dreissena polymorpha]|uniref:Sushi domain-containing protein n=1 Tax=Dreissena polymorpha TaxID=45954 RepID=A0A9D4HKM5_DREPO|nr:hypothetical protein DPMN_063937 [Dreissena polymorpha]